ncbi:MAG: hypothetical protein ACPIE8_06310, partial [Henriciella sp.]
MSDLSREYNAIWPLVMEAGLEQAFDDRGLALVECPACGGAKTLRLSLQNGRAGCQSCGVEAPLESYFQELIERNGPVTITDSGDIEYSVPAAQPSRPEVPVPDNMPAYLPDPVSQNLKPPLQPSVME